MDAITHALVGFAIGHALARVHPKGHPHWAWIGGAAGLGPDFDVFLSPLADVDAFYWVAHRGMTHSLWGAPLAGALFAWLLSKTARQWPVMDVFRYRSGAWLVIVAASWNQPILDGVTHGGAAILFPFVKERISLELYHWMVVYLAPISLLAFVQRFRTRWNDRTASRIALGIVLFLVVLGGARGLMKPPDSYATSDPRDWIVEEWHDNGTLAIVYLESGIEAQRLWFEADHGPAIDHVRGSLAHEAYAFGAIGPVVLRQERVEGGWNVTMTDSVAAMELERLPGWAPERMRERIADDLHRTEFVPA